MTVFDESLELESLKLAARLREAGIPAMMPVQTENWGNSCVSRTASLPFVLVSPDEQPKGCDGQKLADGSQTLVLQSELIGHLKS